MRIVQQRIPEWSTKKSTISEIYVNEVFECHGLEDFDRKLEEGKTEKVYGETAIARGLYRITRTYSNRFKRILPLFRDVKDFTGVRCHPLNKPADSEGCIGVGEFTEGVPDWIKESRKAFEKLDKKIEDAINDGEAVTWEIV